MGIDTLEAGRFLDEIVAEKVFGWDVIHHSNIDARYEAKDFKPFVTWTFQKSLSAFRTRESIIGPWVPWSPSTDIAAAWEVWRDLATRKTSPHWSDFCIALGIVGEESTNYDHDEQPCGSTCDHDPIYDALRSLSPLAICRAALKAMEKES